MIREPERTCVGCRRVRPRAALVRLVRDAEGRVRVDAGGAAPGRGAWVCPDDGCVERAALRGRLSHAFRQACEAGIDLAMAVRTARRR